MLVKFWKLVLQAIQKKKATQTFFFFLLLAKDFTGFGRRLPSKGERERAGEEKERKKNPNTLSGDLKNCS